MLGGGNPAARMLRYVRLTSPFCSSPRQSTFTIRSRRRPGWRGRSRVPRSCGSNPSTGTRQRAVASVTKRSSETRRSGPSASGFLISSRRAINHKGRKGLANKRPQPDVIGGTGPEHPDQVMAVTAAADS
jgi:hypothetical protein